MRIELKVALDLSSRVMPSRVYDLRDDDVRSILVDACDALEGHADFLISGFGQERWPVEVRTDLAVLLEQLPDVLKAVRIGEDAEIDMYEQGIERTLELEPQTEGYLVRCTSRTDWRPVPEVEAIGSGQLEAMLLGVRDAFLAALERLAPMLRRHPWIIDWQQAT